MLTLAIIMSIIGQVVATIAGILHRSRTTATVLGLVAAGLVVGAVFVGRADL